MTTLDFHKFKTPVEQQFNKMTKHDMFRVKINKDELWQAYLNSFPPEVNKIFRKQREYDCSCCRHFVKNIGDVIAIVDGKLETIWDIKSDEPAFQQVAERMAAIVKASVIDNIFLHHEERVGTDKNYQDVDSKVLTWSHFHVRIPTRPNQGRIYYCKGEDLGSRLGDARTNYDVFARALYELKQESIDTILELINEGSLYRGNEFKKKVETFSKLKKKFDKLKTNEEQRLFVWEQVYQSTPDILGIRNSVIGQLLVNLSEEIELRDVDRLEKGEYSTYEVDLDGAVGKYEAMVAPTNYKRPTALITTAQVARAEEKIEELGLTSALYRRYAVLSDVSINDIIFADRNIKPNLKDGLFDGLANKSTTPKTFSKVESISIEKFIKEVVPPATSIEIMFENNNVGNLVSLIAPVHKDAKLLHYWNNGFSWSYKGNVTDSIKERVKQAGGNVTGDLCCRLKWNNYDDLDLHLITPARHEIFFASYKKGRPTPWSPCKGQLDVDMNAGSGATRTPVENIYYPNRATMKEGKYELFVYQYAKREYKDVGFEVEIDFMGEINHFAYEKSVKHGEKILVAEFEYSKEGGIKIGKSLPSSSLSKEVWGIKTQEFHKVSLLMNSPNHWEGEECKGNKHYFFILEGCVRDEEARGIFNEFLRGDLHEHRKVLEVLGNKIKVEDSNTQLSGLGFSDTKRAELIVKVTGNINRIMKVQI